MPRFQFSLRVLLATTAIVAGVCAVVPVLACIDTLFRGPYSTAFNVRCERIVKSRGLMGETPEAVREALGEPSSVWQYGDRGHFTFNYDPHPRFPGATFQAHFSDSRLAGIELFDY